MDVLCKSGSTGKIVYELYKKASAAGHEAAVSYGRGAEVKEHNIFKFGLDWETKFHALLTRITGYTGCFSPFSTKRLIKFIDRFQPDIIHLHEPHAYFLNLRPFFEYLAAKKIPLVYTFHCEFAFTGKCGHPLQCENWKTGCGNCPNLRDYPKTIFFDHTAAMLKEKLRLLEMQNMVITSPSQWLADRTHHSQRHRYRDTVLSQRLSAFTRKARAEGRKGGSGCSSRPDGRAQGREGCAAAG